MQATLNRQLKQSLDEATRTPEERDMSAAEFLQARKEQRRKQQEMIDENS